MFRSSDSADRRFAWATVLLMVGVLAVGVWMATSVFEHTPHVEDEGAYLFQAKTMAAGHLTAPSPPVDAAFFTTRFTIDDGHQWYGKYTPGYPAVLAVGAAVDVAWLVNPIAEAVAVGLTVLLGLRLYGRRTGLLAGVLLALSPMGLLHSGAFFSHPVALCWTVGALLAAERAWRTESHRAGVMVGVCMGMLLLTRPLTAVAIAVPLAIAAAVQVRRGRCRQATRAALGAPMMALGLLLLYNQHTTGSATRFGYEVYWPFDRVGFGPGHGYGAVGHTLDNGWRNTLVNLRQLRSWLFGWPAGLDLVPVIAAVVVALVMVVVWVQRRGRRGADAGPLPAAPTGLGLGSTGFDLLLFGVAASLVVAHLAYWTPGAVHGPRYYYEGMAALALLAARAAGHAAAALRRAGVRADWSRPVVAGAFVALSAVGVVTTTADRVEAARHYYGVRTEGLRAVEALHLHRALVFVPTGHWTDFEPYSAANSPFLDTDVVYAVDMGDRNQELVDAMPDRTAYVWSEGVLTPGSAGG